MEVIGSRWKMPILWNLTQENNLHYNELKRRVIGITNTMLSKCLRELTAEGLLQKTDYKTIPPSTSYSLTEDGRKLMPALSGLYAWGEERMKNSHHKKDI